MDDTIFVYRVERDMGDGPYYKPDAIFHGQAATYNQPVPSWDGIEREIDDQCAFKSVTQFHRWFSDEEVKKLSSSGYKCNVYSVPLTSVKFGNYQVLFKKEHAKVASVGIELTQLKRMCK